MKKIIALILVAVMLAAFCACTPSGNPGNTTVTDVPTETEAPPVTMPDNVAKVIIIAGQSNAVGYTYRNFFTLHDTYKESYSDERLAKADEGYPNILIRYSNNPYDPAQDTCSNDEFEPVKFGMGARNSGYQEEWGLPFGPEMGIAEYLTEKYPDDTFYIIKCATSGTNLKNRWNPDSGDLPKQMIQFVGEQLAGLKEKGLKPEILTFCWMQGESDAQENYITLYTLTFDKLVKKISTELAEYMPPNGMVVADAGIKAVWPNYEAMNAAKQKYADKSSKRYWFDTVWFFAGRDHQDRYHYDCYPMIQLGNAFGECIEKAIEDYGNPEVKT